MIVFAHTEFGLVRIKGSGVKRGGEMQAQAARKRSGFVFPGTNRATRLVNVPDQIGTLSQVGTSSYMAYAM